MSPGVDAVGERPRQPQPIELLMKPAMFGRRHIARRVNIDRLVGGTGLGTHGHRITGDHNSVGQRQDSGIGIFVCLTPQVLEAADADGIGQRLRGASAGAP